MSLACGVRLAGGCGGCFRAGAAEVGGRRGESLFEESLDFSRLPRIFSWIAGIRGGGALDGGGIFRREFAENVGGEAGIFGMEFHGESGVSGTDVVREDFAQALEAGVDEEADVAGGEAGDGLDFLIAEVLVGI